MLAIGNAFLKPILAILTFPLIILTLGLAYFAINVAMLALAEWVAPDFSIGFWTYVGATIVVWFVNFVVGRGLDYLEVAAGGALKSASARANPRARRAFHPLPPGRLPRPGGGQGRLVR